MIIRSLHGIFYPSVQKYQIGGLYHFFFCLEICVFVTQCIAPPRRLCHNAFVDRYKELLSFVWIIDLSRFCSNNAGKLLTGMP